MNSPLRAFCKLLSALLLIGLIGCQSTPEDDGLMWEKFQSEEGRFSAQFHNNVFKTRAKIRFGDTDSLYTYYFMSDDSASHSLLSISYTDYPAGFMHSDSANAVSQFLAGVAQNAVIGIEGRVAAETDTPYGRYPGKDIEILFNNDSSFMKLRCYLVGSRLYTVQAATKTASKDSPFIGKFMTSFILKD